MGGAAQKNIYPRRSPQEKHRAENTIKGKPPTSGGALRP